MARCVMRYVVIWRDLKDSRVKVRECVRRSSADEIRQSLTLRGFQTELRALDAYGQETLCD